MTRRILLAGGLLTLGLLWLGPLPELAARRFSAHMTLHMGVVAVAAPLLALAVAGGRFDPARWRPVWFAAIPASMLELAVVWSWHAPVLHRFARSTAAGLVAEQGSFLVSGLLVWIAAFGGDCDRGGHRAGAGVVALLLTSMHMTLLGALIALAPRSLYAGVHAAHGVTGLAEQELGGAIMLLVGGASYLAGGLALSATLLTRRSPKRGVGRG